MPSDKPRIATYTTEEQVRKFRIVSAYNKRSMSEYLAVLIDRAIEEYEREHGELKDIGVSPMEKYERIAVHKNDIAVIKKMILKGYTKEEIMDLEYTEEDYAEASAELGDTENLCD